MVPILTAPCLKCARLKMSDDNNAWGWFCEAYPIGGTIPEMITSGTVPHTEPYVGDRGILFSPGANEFNKKKEVPYTVVFP